MIETINQVGTFGSGGGGTVSILISVEDMISLCIYYRDQGGEGKEAKLHIQGILSLSLFVLIFFSQFKIKNETAKISGTVIKARDFTKPVLTSWNRNPLLR